MCSDVIATFPNTLGHMSEWLVGLCFSMGIMHRAIALAHNGIQFAANNTYLNQQSYTHTHTLSLSHPIAYCWKCSHTTSRNLVVEALGI